MTLEYRVMMNRSRIQSDIPEQSLTDVVDPIAKYVAEEVVTGAVLWSLEAYARKRPLSLTGRIIGHALPFVGVAFYAYDIYQLADHIYSEY